MTLDPDHLIILEAAKLRCLYSYHYRAALRRLRKDGYLLPNDDVSEKGQAAIDEADAKAESEGGPNEPIKPFDKCVTMLDTLRAVTSSVKQGDVTGVMLVAKLNKADGSVLSFINGAFTPGEALHGTELLRIEIDARIREQIKNSGKHVDHYPNPRLRPPGEHAPKFVDDTGVTWAPVAGCPGAVSIIDTPGDTIDLRYHRDQAQERTVFYDRTSDWRPADIDRPLQFLGAAIKRLWPAYALEAQEAIFKAEEEAQEARLRAEEEAEEEEAEEEEAEEETEEEETEEEETEEEAEAPPKATPYLIGVTSDPHSWRHGMATWERGPSERSVRIRNAAPNCLYTWRLTSSGHMLRGKPFEVAESVSASNYTYLDRCAVLAIDHLWGPPS
jgi:hypothetical protein